MPLVCAAGQSKSAGVMLAFQASVLLAPCRDTSDSYRQSFKWSPVYRWLNSLLTHASLNHCHGAAQIWQEVGASVTNCW